MESPQSDAELLESIVPDLLFGIKGLFMPNSSSGFLALQTPTAPPAPCTD